LPGRFAFQATFIQGKPNPRKVPARLNSFSLELWNQSPPEWFEATVGLGSMSLILLHHLLFHVRSAIGTARLMAQSRITSTQIRCGLRHEETL
jgi:hypothetical protein